MAELRVNDSGTWRNIQQVQVNDSGTWRTIQEVYVNDAGTWRSVFSNGVLPVQHMYISGSSATETAPAGASQVVIEVFGGSGNGGHGADDTGIPSWWGGGGGSGGYSRTTVAISAGQTLTYTVGGISGTSSVSSGTKSITTLQGTGGGAGVDAVGGGAGNNGAGGTAGAASGGTDVNQNGNAGSSFNGTNAPGGAGKTGVNANGNVGGSGGLGVSDIGRTVGDTGRISFYYT